MSDFVRNKWVYSLLWLTVIAMIVWIIAGTRQDTVSENVSADRETYTMETSAYTDAEKASETAVTGYYLILAEDETVNVYWVDENGRHLHLETSIPYSLLSVEDQNLLDIGVKVKTDQELAGFLENYDS